jgi:chaperone BCS1
MDHVIRLWLVFTAYTKTNPIFAGAISLWGLSLLTVVFRKFPAKLGAWAYGQITTTLEFDNTELGFARDNYAGFMQWYMARKQVNFTRHFSVMNSGAPVDKSIEVNGKAAVVGVGSGTHYFFYKGRLCQMRRTLIEKTGRENNIYLIKVTLFSRKKKLVDQLVDEFCHKFDMEKQRIYRYGQTGRFWSSDGSIRKRPLKTVIANVQLKRRIIKEIEQFLLDRQWYYDRGLPYKLTIVLHGNPGGGKTSLIKAIAAYFGMHIARLNLAEMTDGMLEDGLASVPTKSIVLMEDFDSADAVKTREAMKKKLELKRKKDEVGEEADNSNKKISFVENSGLTLSGVLNALDGVVELDGTIIFMTTNVLDEIDPAVIRKGRVDMIEEVPALGHKEIVEYIELMFPNVIVGNDVTYDPIMGCDLQALYFDHSESVHDFMAAIPGARTDSLLVGRTYENFQLYPQVLPQKEAA